LNLFANPALFMGGTVLIMQSFEAEVALGLLTRAQEPVTHFCGVPAHYEFRDQRGRVDGHHDPGHHDPGRPRDRGTGRRGRADVAPAMPGGSG
ncbi:MAG TPA: hypothetical protein VIK57_10935, partial [Streptosporangiaceae bacterium]